jgi:hypothetical protein
MTSQIFLEILAENGLGRWWIFDAASRTKVQFENFLMEEGLTDDSMAFAIDAAAAIKEGYHIVDISPLVKYPPNSNYANLYPNLTEYLKNKLPQISNNDFIVNSIKKYTHLTKAQIEHGLKWNEGPTIKIEQLGLSSNNGEIYGVFRSSEPTTLFIDIDLVNDLESSKGRGNLADSFSFLMGVTILHEYVHFGDNYDGKDYPGEEGSLFETDVYGQTVNRTNAQLILEKN